MTFFRNADCVHVDGLLLRIKDAKTAGRVGWYEYESFSLLAYRK